MTTRTTTQSTKTSKNESWTDSKAAKVALGTAAAAAVGVAAYKTLSHSDSVYEVKMNGDGWQVKKESASRASGLYATKKEAVAAARELAHKKAPSELRIYNSDGELGDAHSYEVESN